jgi:hypothetical protein
LATFLGGGAIFKTIAERKLRNADQQAELDAKVEADEDTARKSFRDELRDTIKQLYAEIAALRLLHENCQKDRLKDREELSYMRGQMELMTGKMVIVPAALIGPAIAGEPKESIK